MHSLRMKIGTCSQCGGDVTIPAGPIGYAGPLENLMQCSQCGAKKSNAKLPVIDMDPVRPIPFGLGLYRS